MLPRCEMYKEILFTPRLIAFNESFVATSGCSTKYGLGPTAVLWHEAIRGRSKEDIISTFYAYFLSVRDAKHIILWLDNCAAQNKNWCLYSFFIYLINSDVVSLEFLEVKYFESGHTFMAADSFHHSVESSLKKQQKVYDFNDFVTCVKSVPRSNVIELKIDDFFIWKDYSSQYKLRKITPRPYMQKMVKVSFKRGTTAMSYQNDFTEPELQINFINATFAKNGIPKPMAHSIPRGISTTRKNTILSKLVSIMPQTRIPFWENLPTIEEELPLSDNE